MITFIVQTKLIDGSWYQCHETSLLLNAVKWKERCPPDRLYRIAQREVVITTLDL